MGRTWPTLLVAHVVVGACLVVVPQLAHATDVPAPQTLTPGDGDSGDLFGENVAIAGNTLVVSSSNHVHDSTAGAVYVYEETVAGWEFVQELVPEGISPTNNFGSAPGSVAVDGDRIVVGDTYSEAAYAFQKIDGQWQFTQKIPNPKGTDRDINFGDAVAMSGNRLAVSYPFPGNGGIVFYDFNGSSWQYVQESIPVALEDKRLGESLAMYGDVLVAGAPNYGGWWGSGVLAVFIRSGATWYYDGLLIADGVTQMGWSVAISSGLTIAASSNEEFDGYGVGSVYVWERVDNDWEIADELHPSNTQYWESFGPYVSIYGDTILIGKDFDDHGASNSGAAYVYKRGTSSWSLDTVLYPPTPQTNQVFGRSVAAYNGVWVVGAPYGGTAGKAFVYDFLPIDIFADGFESNNTTAWSNSVP